MQISQSKNGFKNSLALAVSSYVFVLGKIEKLEEEIKFYEHKMLSIGGPTYGTNIRGVRNPYDNKLIYWIDKIDKVKIKIDTLESSIKDFLDFFHSLNALEQTLVQHNMIHDKTIVETAKLLNLTINKLNKIKYEIQLKWKKYNFCC